MSKEVEYIRHDDVLLAIIVRAHFQKDGIEFFTPKELSQQLGYMKHPAGHRIAAHIHKLVVREIEYTQETILVKSGKIRVDFFSQDRKHMRSDVLTTGDVVLLASGGHGFFFLEESELIEIKQGPYLSFEVDKERFEGIHE